ncbi:MarP family serine protease [Agromyces archimandritae]|uniref:MarP family serine protease n=1 Tax=Agromyces archimandritae TaxID=2781962 RepID=UPI001FD0AAF4|nr:MarP family serine protease [Agromyces archimandritae]
MAWTLLIDVVIVLVFIGALVNGFRAGLLRTAAGLVGLVAGGIAAFFVMPLTMSWIPFPEWRVAASIAVAVLLLIIGSWLGAAVGRTLRRGAKAVKLGMLDRILGAVGNLLVTALVVMLVGTGVRAMAVPVLSPALSSSWVLRSIEAITPEPAQRFIAEVRGAATEQALPWLTEVLGGPKTAPALPDFALDNPALVTATDSVVRVTGNAFQCGQNLSGSGFVVADDRVVTNAHVVAGVDEPIIEAPGEDPVAGRVVAFDPEHDLAVIAAPGLDADALDLADALGDGSPAAVAGYPFGGPFTLGAAEVMSTGSLLVESDGVQSSREVITLAATVQHGNSGGPLLTMDGDVAGVIFAKSETVDNVGYAVPMSELAPLAAEAPSLSEQVGSGSCVG